MSTTINTVCRKGGGHLTYLFAEKGSAVI